MKKGGYTLFTVLKKAKDINLFICAFDQKLFESDYFYTVLMPLELKFRCKCKCRIYLHCTVLIRGLEWFHWTISSGNIFEFEKSVEGTAKEK